MVGEKPFNFACLCCCFKLPEAALYGIRALVMPTKGYWWEHVGWDREEQDHALSAAFLLDWLSCKIKSHSV